MHLMGGFTCSTQGKLFDIQYDLKCVIKHDCWNEFGEGYKVTLPLKINAPPMFGVPQLPPANFATPPNWQPVQTPMYVAPPNF